MLLIPLPYQGKLRLLIVLEDDNITRIKEHDNAEVIWSQLKQFAHLMPDVIAIGYVSPEEAVKLYDMANKGDMAGCVKLVTSGFKYRPELGDHDLGPKSIKGKSDA